MNEFGITSLVVGVVFLAFALWVKPTNSHQNSVK